MTARTARTATTITATTPTTPETTAIDETAPTVRCPVATDTTAEGLITSGQNDNGSVPPPSTLERDLEAVIMAAAAGSKHAKDILRPVVYRIALASLIHIDDAGRVTRKVLRRLGTRTGMPVAGRATTFLEVVIRTYADQDFADTSREQYEAHDPPAGKRRRKRRE
jgi:hypothetical protein